MASLRVRLQVYKARWQGLLVAVKILSAEESAQQEEFKKEVAMLEALRHPHIVNYLGHIFQESGEVGVTPTPKRMFKSPEDFTQNHPGSRKCASCLPGRGRDDVLKVCLSKWLYEGHCWW